MPSFDVVSEIDKHELANAVDQANREVGTRFDFKDSGANFVLSEAVVTLTGQSDFQLQQMRDILYTKLSKRGVDIQAAEASDPEQGLKVARQTVTLREGIDAAVAKKMVRLIKDSKIKVQAQIQGEQLRVTGKKRDDLQQVMAMLKQADLGLPLQFTNFRD